MPLAAVTNVAKKEEGRGGAGGAGAGEGRNTMREREGQERRSGRQARGSLGMTSTSWLLSNGRTRSSGPTKSRTVGGG